MNSTRLCVVLLALVVTGCVPMKTLRGSSGIFLTPAGSKVTVNHPGVTTASVVQQMFGERGYSMVNRSQVSPNNVVMYFKGARNMYAPQQPGDPMNGAQGQLGSWFAVRVTDDGVRSVVSFYGKPVVYGMEVCADGDTQLNDVQYRCSDVRVREDWPMGQWVEGREETEVISSIIAGIADRLPPR